MSETQIDPTDAERVLWHFGMKGGVEPGGFYKALIIAISHADSLNRQSLAKAYPSLVEAFQIANQPQGGFTLQEIVGAR